jgi:hypothetical protein
VQPSRVVSCPVLVGEAGIGKTRLLEAIRERAAAAGFAVRGAGAYPGDAEVAGGLLADLFPGADAAAEPGGDPHRQRRLLLAGLARRVLDLAANGPVLLALEDLHWADELTLDALERAAVEHILTKLGAARRAEIAAWAAAALADVHNFRGSRVAGPTVSITDR